MDTLPLNGNHNNSYSIARGEYLSDCVQIIESGFKQKDKNLEKKILKELTSRYVPSYKNNHEASYEQNRNLMNKLVSNTNKINKDNVIVLDDTTSFSHDESLGLELIYEESDAPLLPTQVYKADNHYPHHFNGKWIPLLTKEHTEFQAPKRDSLYTSMPTLIGLAMTENLNNSSQTDSPPANDAEDVYYKSMPNLGTQNHIHQLLTYYPLGQGSSEGITITPSKDGTPCEENSKGTTHLVTSL